MNNVFWCVTMHTDFQPGNGKLKIKEPTDAINKAIKELDGIIQEASSS